MKSKIFNVHILLFSFSRSVKVNHPGQLFGNCSIINIIFIPDKLAVGTHATKTSLVYKCTYFSEPHSCNTMDNGFIYINAYLNTEITISF